MICIDLSETIQKKKNTGNLRENSVRDKIQEFFLTKFFSQEKKFVKKNSPILSRTEFCLGLHTAVVFRLQSLNNIRIVPGCAQHLCYKLTFSCIPKTMYMLLH